jgi:hypothetical protein
MRFFVFGGFHSVAPLSMVSLGFEQPLFDSFDLPYWGRHTFRGFFLKSMQNINSIPESDGINHPPSVAVVRGDDLNHTSASKTF